MCTLTIHRDDSSLLVTMNRDDIRERLEAPPALWPDTQTTFAAPKDLLAGGTWIGVSAHGVIACLLNRYDVAPPGAQSRGAIVLAAMREPNLKAASQALSALPHRDYSPFTCLLVTRSGAQRLDWNGDAFERCDLAPEGDLVVTSSSWRFEEVRRKREDLFRTLWLNGSNAADRLAAFHTGRVQADDAWRPMMQRPASHTKSITQAVLDEDGAQMRYWSRERALSHALSAPETSIRL